MKVRIEFEIEDIYASEVVSLCSALVSDDPIGTSPVHDELPSALIQMIDKIKGDDGLYEQDLTLWDENDLRIMRWFAKGPD